MPNQKISELTAVTIPLPGDVLPIVNGGTTKRVAVSGVAGVRMSGNGSLTSNQAAPFGVNSITFGYGALGKFNPAGASSLSIDNIIIGCDNAKLKNCQGGSERVACNVFLGTGIASTYPDCATGSQPIYNQGTRDNVFIGTRAARDVFSFFEQNTGQCGTYTSDYTVACNIAIGANAAANRQKLRQNVVIGSSAHALLTLCNSTNYTGNGTGTVAIGNYAGNNSMYGSLNVFIGKSAGAFSGTCTVGIRNVGIGANAFAGRKDTRYSVAIGNRAFANETNQTGFVGFSIGIGRKAGSRLTSSINDVIIGADTVSGANYGSIGSLSATNNTILGNRAMGFTNVNNAANLMLRDNTIIGACGGWCSSGSYNIMIGTNTAVSDTFKSLSGTIVLGNCAQPLANNTLVLGSATFPLSTVATAGAAAGFLIVNINGTHRKIAFNS